MNPKSRREFIKQATLATAGIAVATKGLAALNVNDEKNEFSLPALSYKYEALEPHIDALTMQIHHGKHHQTYVDKLNEALKPHAHEQKGIEEILKNISKYSVAVRNNGGGHYNHSLYWKLMTPNGGSIPTGKLADAINASFGDLEKMKQLFKDTAKSRFGSGWAWLIKNPEGKLEICSTPNQDNPLMDIAEKKGKPVLALDVWEHAYYLKHQNKRADYITAWWNVVNWVEAGTQFS